MRKSPAYLSTASVLVFFSLAATGCRDGSGGGDDNGSRDESYIAESVCEDFVEARLRAPATAEFGDANVTRRGDNEYIVESAVDSENGFGALIRSSYTCTVRYTESTKVFTLISLTGLDG